MSTPGRSTEAQPAVLSPTTAATGSLVPPREPEMSPGLALSAAQVERFGSLTALQRHLHGASTVGELLGRACVEATRCCGFQRGVILSADGGALTARGMRAVEHRACDALRRHTLAHPVPLLPGSAEARVLRRPENGSRTRRAGPSVLKDALGLDQFALAPVVPESRAVALLVLDRQGAAVNDDDRAAVDLVAHLLGLALERLVLRLRMDELSREFRHLTASAHALMHEALETPIGLTTDLGQGPVFAVAGMHVPEPDELAELLTPREREIAALMVGGRSNREIGEELHLSTETVKANVGRLVGKLGATNRVDAVARYVTMTHTVGS